MSSAFLGAGWAHPVRRGEDERTLMAAYEASIHDAMWLILATARGERMMRPDFGCELSSLVFSPNNSSTADLARYYVSDAFARWEPRIDVLDVVVGNDVLLGHLVIDVRYRLRALGTVQSLIHRLPLEGAG